MTAAVTAEVVRGSMSALGSAVAFATSLVAEGGKMH